MSNSIRFEFYNNFDIWYDLYQENGGDPNYIINMMMYSDKSKKMIKLLFRNKEICCYSLCGNGIKLMLVNDSNIVSLNECGCGIQSNVLQPIENRNAVESGVDINFFNDIFGNNTK